ATLSYQELLRRAGALAAVANRERPREEPPLTAIYAHRSATAFSGVLASLLRGTGYVPLNPTHPPPRVRDILLESRWRLVILDSTAELQIDETLGGLDQSLVLLFPERTDITGIARRLSQHKVLGRDAIVNSELCEPVSVDPRSIAYLLFTSGS